MKIRMAEIKDAKGIAKVHVDTWRSTYKGIVPYEFLEQLTYESREILWNGAIPNGNVFVAENHDGNIVGFSTGGKERSGNYKDYEGELYAIYLIKEYQGMGLGRKLVEPIVNLLKKENINTMLVLVLEENNSCLFYEALGARKIETIEIEMAGKKLKEAVYGWDDLETVFERCE